MIHPDPAEKGILLSSVWNKVARKISGSRNTSD
jgi:hypothetical protein